MRFVEGLCVELKTIYVPDIKKTVVAFANTNGGTIYIGVTDDGDVVGVNNADDVLLQAVHAIRDAIKPDITLFTECSIEEIENKKVITVTIQRGVNRPYYLSDKGLKSSGVYKRQGSASIPVSDDGIRQMIRETDGESYEKVRSLDRDLTFIYASMEMENRHLEFGLSQKQTLGIINSDGFYTNLGLLVSDQCPHLIKIAYFEGLDNKVFKDRREFSGSILQQLTDAYNYLDIFNRVRSTFPGLHRLDERDYPPDAIREALMNAIVHREYALSGSIIINVYDNRMEFISIGGLVPGLSMEAVLIGVSRPRNEKLANVFYILKLIEAYGTGIRRIISSYESSTQSPTIKALEGAFLVVLPNLHADFIHREAAEVGSQVGETISEYQVKAQQIKLHQVNSHQVNSNKVIPQQVKPQQVNSPQYRKVLENLSKQGFITRRGIQEVLNVGQTRALNIANEMIEKGFIYSEGLGRTTEYRLRTMSK
jgi:ATP-dependent DNA helicase RecG